MSISFPGLPDRWEEVGGRRSARRSLGSCFVGFRGSGSRCKAQCLAHYCSGKECVTTTALLHKAVQENIHIKVTNRVWGTHLSESSTGFQQQRGVYKFSHTLKRPSRGLASNCTACECRTVRRDALPRIKPRPAPDDKLWYRFQTAMLSTEPARF